jgi:hypothetical protein
MNSTSKTNATSPAALDSESGLQEGISTATDDVLEVSLRHFQAAAMDTRNAELAADCRSMAAAIARQIALRKRVVPEPN